MRLPSSMTIKTEVARALEENRPVVALESTVITHGLPYPENRQLAEAMEREIRACDVTPATIGVLDGIVHVGLSAEQIDRLAQGEQMYKISTRNFGPAIALGQSGGTTVAGTMVAARLAGIRVFATGGIGGVHRDAPFDISADLPELARTPMVVVCAGAKAILDIPATLEYLETAAVTVVGYGTNEFPAFYSRTSGFKTSASADNAAQVAAIAYAHWELGLSGAVLVTVPPPEKEALPGDEVERAIQTALSEASALQVRGQQVTPFLLKRVSELTGGASLRANLALLLNNARTAALIARAMVVG